MPIVKAAKGPIERLHCGECNHQMKVHKLYTTMTTCVNKHCPQYQARFPLPARYVTTEPEAA